MTIPAGFLPFSKPGPFATLIGPLYEKPAARRLQLGLLIETRHCNRRNFAHAGVLVTLADLTLGYAIGHDGGRTGVTASLSVDFAGSAEIGQWVEAEADVQKVGRNVAFANCYVRAEGVRIVRASGVFRVT